MSRSKLADFLMYAVHGVNTPYARRSGRRRVRRGPARSWKYRQWIRSLPSVVSGSDGCEAAHTGGDGGTGQKSSDFSCIPLTAVEHRLYHQVGRDRFEIRYRINCRELVKRLNSLWFGHAQEVK
jgi:hypothetical protein